jgi:ABC-type dipeptide/oligopeptide/nickel transport system permease component
MHLLLYLAKKVAVTVSLLLGITLITFSLTRSLPGDPALALVGERASQEVIEGIRRELGADRPFFEQYAGYLGLVARGDLGRSYSTKKEVRSELLSRFPNTMRLALFAMLLATPAGIGLGFLAALKKNTRVDAFVSSVSVAGVSVPVFFSGLLLMMLASLHLKLFPPSGTGGLRFMVLPAVTLSLPAVASLARVTRATAMDIIEMPFVKTARAKGLGELKVNIVHILRNALIPIVTVIGLDFGSYLNGAVLTEAIFGWDGIGRLAMEGIIKRDYPVVMGTILLGTVVFILINMVVDMAYHVLDPRVRVLHGRKG